MMGATNHMDRIYAQQPSCVTISSVASKPVSLLLDAMTEDFLHHTYHPLDMSSQLDSSSSLLHHVAFGWTSGVLPILRASLVNQLAGL